MKTAKVLLVVLITILAYQLGKLNEQQNNIKDYQAACVLNDCCRNMVDNIGTDAEEIYYDYLDNLDCDSNLIITRDDIADYAWSY